VSFFSVFKLDGTAGFGVYTLDINTAPEGGHCVVEPKEGVVLQTTFSVHCYNFTDPQQPLYYLIFTQTKDSSRKYLKSE